MDSVGACRGAYRRFCNSYAGRLRPQERDDLFEGGRDVLLRVALARRQHALRPCSGVTHRATARCESVGGVVDAAGYRLSFLGGGLAGEGLAEIGEGHAWMVAARTVCGQAEPTVQCAVREPTVRGMTKRCTGSSLFTPASAA